eukprot:41905-Eustigmatos_ZCMA.PRE.1
MHTCIHEAATSIACHCGDRWGCSRRSRRLVCFICIRVLKHFHNLPPPPPQIPDVTIVIDCGRVKESGYDPQSRMACLVEGWTSRDSIRQRRGRAGR